MAWTAGVVLVNQLTRVKPTTSAEQIVILGTIVALALGFKVQGGSADWADGNISSTSKLEADGEPDFTGRPSQLRQGRSAAYSGFMCEHRTTLARRAESQTRLPIQPPPITEIVRRPTPVPNAPAPLPSLSASGGHASVLSNEEERLDAFDDRRRNLLKFVSANTTETQAED